MQEGVEHGFSVHYIPEAGSFVPLVQVRQARAMEQAGHVKGTPQYANRVKAGKPTSCFCDWNAAIKYTDEAWVNGTPVAGNPGKRDYEFGAPIGEGPRGGTQSKVRVHQDSKGKIHGHPAGPETP